MFLFPIRHMALCVCVHVVMFMNEPADLLAHHERQIVEVSREQRHD